MEENKKEVMEVLKELSSEREKNTEETTERWYNLADSPFFTVAVAIIILGVIGGLICGGVFETVIVHSGYSSFTSHSHNWGLAITVIVVSLLQSVLFFFFGTVDKHNKTVRHEIDEIKDILRNNNGENK